MIKVHFVSNYSSYKSSEVVDARARLHPSGCNLSWLASKQIWGEENSLICPLSILRRRREGCVYTAQPVIINNYE